MYDYAAGQLDWFASGLPREGRQAAVPWAGDLALRAVPTCWLEERLGDVRPRLEAGDWEVCAVVNAERIVLGLLDRAALVGNPQVAVQAVMRPGPSTFRPNVPAAEMADYFARHEMQHALITTLDGRLIGLLRRTDAERAAARSS
ncbi:MAG: CBS domain-containing protein [Chloroflexi bacterium]|nr:CBS domain-containing protein [Chloroflexota bacterium]